MAITNQFTSLFAHVMFVPEGVAYTTPSSGTTGVAAKAGAADAVWATYNLGDCEEFKIVPESDSAEVMGGDPGGLVITNIVPLSKKLKITFNAQQITPVVLQLLMGTLALTGASTQANFLEGQLIKKGWLKFQAYDVDGTSRVLGDKWGALKITSAEPWSGKNIVKASFELTSIRSALDTISFL